MSKTVFCLFEIEANEGCKLLSVWDDLSEVVTARDKLGTAAKKDRKSKVFTYEIEVFTVKSGPCKCGGCHGDCHGK